MAGEGEEKEHGEPLDLTGLELKHLLGLFVGILSAKGWQYMGLRLAPGEKEAKKEMMKAAAAIDCAAFLAEKLAPLLPEAEALRLRAVITDLQINYAKNA